MVGLIHQFLIFNRKGACLFHLNLQNPENLLPDLQDDKQLQRYKLIIGLLFSLKSFTKLIHGKPFHGFRSYTTQQYKLHFFEVPSGLKFVLISKPTKYDFQSRLQDLYQQIYVPLVALNNFYIPDSPIECSLFIKYSKTFLESVK